MMLIWRVVTVITQTTISMPNGKKSVMSEKTIDDVDKEKDRKATIPATPKQYTIVINDDPPVEGGNNQTANIIIDMTEGEKLANEVFKTGVGSRSGKKLNKSTTTKGGRVGRVPKEERGKFLHAEYCRLIKNKGLNNLFWWYNQEITCTLCNVNLSQVKYMKQHTESVVHVNLNKYAVVRKEKNL